MKLRNTKALVKSILETNADARNSDMRLYFEVCRRLNASALDFPFGRVILKLDKLNLPPFESVRRSRQKLQEKYPELAANDVVQVYRAENEQEYREFARGQE